jgi:hypothetical protein
LRFYARSQLRRNRAARSRRERGFAVCADAAAKMSCFDRFENV